ncbi:hypothetical protein SAMN05443637_11429 [Pseudonocardia thermophila]|uniref:UPF0182 protein SAMN05443637_11429 n=2 Tax=Pseudonocardia thermophila TaxID=1848 RepID=A0A1M6W8R1_PSETH|nr:hypothetical protein SAMN05443637_11429 [Pseudonocardia thermophila]
MAMRPPVGPPTLTRRTKILLVVAGVLILLTFVGNFLINNYIDWLWFGEVGYRGVFTTVLFTQFVTALAGGLLMAGASLLSFWLAYRSRPVFVPVGRPDDPLVRVRSRIQESLPVFRLVLGGVTGIAGAMVALGDWKTVLQFLNSTPFGITDPEFGLDVGFYAFDLPFYRYLLNWLFAAVAIGFFIALVTHYLFGGIRLTGRSAQISTAARTQLAITAGIFVLLKAVAYGLDRYELLSSDRKAGIFYGATYTDLNAVMPAKLILLIISIICALAFFAAVFRSNLQLPAIATVLLVLSSILIGAAWPAVLEQFVVTPNAQERESVSIQRNIDATKAAFGIGDDRVTKVPYDAVPKVPDQVVRQDEATLSNVRLLDPAKLSATFTQLQQQNRKFYGYPDKLDIDRYEVNGKLQDYIVALRELKTSELTGPQADWINRRLVYTHGDGIVVAPANQVGQVLSDNSTNGGLPNLTAIDLANKDNPNIPESLRVEETRTYYGELIEGYSIVGGSDGGKPLEYDADGAPRSSYAGKGGVPIGNLFNRLVFALHYSERNILFNNSINENSKILYVRDPRERVKKVAPWLTTDSDPYPAVVDGRITWIVDGYTTLSNYPYAQSVELGESTADAQQMLQRSVQPDQRISYLRNSVKATVDAYDGTVTLYEFDDQDPVLKTWMKAFPGTVKPKSEISQNLSEHFRYPEDQFKVQRELLTRYHVESTGDFYGGVSFWDVPSDPTVTPTTPIPGANAQPPYYVLAGPPGATGATEASFQLTSVLTFRGRDNMAAYVSVNSDPEEYGKFTVLQLPPDGRIFGPRQVHDAFNNNGTVSSQLTVLRNQNTAIDFGNLLTLPVAGGLVYVEPLFLERAGSGTTYAQLARVLVYYNGRVGFSPSVKDALDAAIAGSGTAPPAAGQQPAPPAPQQPPNQGAAPAPSAPSGPLSPEAAAAATEFARAYEQFKAAQRNNDFAGQAAALQAMDAAVARFQRATGSSAVPAPGETGG